MNKNKQLAINMVAQIIAFVVNFLISFFLTPYIVKHVGKEAYGFVGLANNFISYATIITTALNSMASRFITISIHKGNYEDTNRYMTSVVFANVILAVPITVAGVILLMFLEDLVQVPLNILWDVKILWALLFANFIIGLITNVFNVATFAQNRLELSSMRGIQSNILKVVILVVAFGFFKPSVWYLGFSTLLCGIFVIITNMYYTKTLLPFVEIKKKYVDLRKVKELVMSGIWNSISQISSTLSTGLDLLITNLFVGASAMGTVSVAKTLPTYILSVFAMLSSVFAPQLTISYAKDDFDDIRNQLMSAIKLLGFFSCIPVACLYIFGSDFFGLWMPEQDAKLLQTLSIMASGAFIFCLPLEPLWNIFTVTNKVKQSSLFLMMNAFVSVFFTFVLLQITSDENMKMYIVVGTSTVLSIIRALTFLPVYGAKCLKFKWYTFYPVIFKNTISVVVTTLIAVVLRSILNINSWLMLIIAVFLTSFLALMLNNFIILSRKEREILKSKLLKRRR